MQDPQRLQKKRSRQRPLIKTNSRSSAISTPLLAQSASLQTIGRDGCRFSSNRLGGGCCGGGGNRWRGRERDRKGRRMSLEPPRLNLGVRHNGKPRGVHRIRWESVRVLLPKVAYSFALRGSSRRVCIVWSFCLAISGLEGHWAPAVGYVLSGLFVLRFRASKDTGAPAVGYILRGLFVWQLLSPRKTGAPAVGYVHSVLFSLCREAQRDPERPREAQRGPERPREAQRGPERPREAQRASEKHRDAQRGPERLRKTHRDAQKSSTEQKTESPQAVPREMM